MTEQAPPVAEEDRRLIVFGALLVMMLAALDQTIVAPALPTIGASLGHPEWLSWVISAYFLTATAVTPLYGKLADIKGRRLVLFVAIGIFVVGSVLCAAAPNMALLVVGRAVQGLGGGGLIALAQTIIADVVPPRERPRYMVYITAVWALASIAGPVVGGLFAQHVHWSLIFWVNLPLAAVAVFATNRTLKKLPIQRRDHRLDVGGAVLVVTATVALLLALTWGGTRFAWLSAPIVTLIGGSLLLFAAFARHLGKTPEPLIPLHVLANPVVAMATAAVFFSMVSFVGLSVYLPLYMEMLHGLNAGEAGIALVAFMIGTVTGANTAGRYMARIRHYRRLAVGGSVLAVCALGAMAATAADASFWAMEVMTFVAGAGIGTLFPVATICVQNAVEPKDLGVATGTLSFMRALGSAIGVAALGAVLLGHGVVEAIGEGAGVSQAAERTAAGAAFTTLFLAAVASQLLGLCFLLMMRELPLRGAAQSAVAE
ncbi:MDR family MFS transporter [Methylobrevis pamukkalensis]|uniref:Multidrug resistance protein 3 n=1 Tax=Methylobrevis pamukkalensis TaxID=1439726 RepID=A0A1E3H534_9HYPH|nr:MDR family MFS transporter [Methylobrevis pamukkalensis]ODN70886.1 Multidrug resistance protein 3 [Methylobrevis pamukkalensis]